MRKELAVMAKVLLVLMIGQLAIMPAQAVMFGVTAPVYTEQTSKEMTTGKVQVTVTYKDGTVWQWDEAQSSYLGTFPTGIGAMMKIYPNVLADLPVIAMIASESELERKLEYHYDRTTKTWVFTTQGVISLQRDSGGRWYLSVPLESFIGTDIHCLRFYALVKDAKRNDHEINALLFKIKWVGKDNVASMVDTIRFKTESWPAGVAEPSIQYLADLLRRAGNGGNGLVFETLLANDGAKVNVGNVGTGATGSNVVYNNDSNLRELASLQARVASLEAYDLKVWDAVQALARNSGKTETEIQRLRQLVANHELTLVKVIDYLKEGPSPQKESVYGNYSFRTSQKVWIKLYDRANPQGRVFGPYCAGNIPINGALIGERCNGDVKAVEYRVRWSVNGQNWSDLLTFKPYLNSVIGLP